MRARRRALLVVASVLCVGSPSIHAQSALRLRVGVTAPATPSVVALLGLRPAESRSHWREGLVAGAIVGFFIAAAAAGYDDGGASIGRRVGLGLVGAAVLSVPGTLIGGLFPKD